MKKLFSLVLTLALLLTAVSAFAAGSKEEPSGGGTVVPVTEETPEIGISFIDDTDASAAAIKAFGEAKDAGDVLAPLPEDVSALVPEGFGTINDLKTAQFDGEVDKVTEDMLINVMFETPYAEGQKVIVLIGILPEAEGEIEWKVFEGVGKADGSVDVTVTKDVFEKVKTNPFLIGVISE